MLLAQPNHLRSRGSHGANFPADTGSMEGAEAYFDAMLESVREMVKPGKHRGTVPNLITAAGRSTGRESNMIYAMSATGVPHRQV